MRPDWIDPRTWPDRVIALAFALTAIVIRIPMMRPLTLQLDEHTYLLMGRDLLNGHLPYTHLWEVKPPLLFVVTALVSLFAQHEIWVVRLAASLCDVSTALLVKLIADRVFAASKPNWLCAVICFAALTTSGTGGALMSETATLPFIMAGVYFLCERQPSRVRGYIGGVFFGVATLMRVFPAFPAVAAILAIGAEAIVARVGDARKALWTTLVFVCLGGATVLALVLAAYALAGKLELFYHSVVLAPLAYEEGGGSGGSTLVAFLRATISGNAMLLTVAFGVGGFVFTALRDRGNWPAWRLAAMAAAQFVAFTFGPPLTHYFVLLLPFFAIFAAPALRAIFEVLRPPVLRTGLAALIAAAPMLVSARAAWRAGDAHDTTAEVYSELRAAMQPGDTLYATSDYVLYWLLDRDPPHPIVTHAGNLFRPYMFRELPFGVETSAELMQRIVATHPTWIVFSDETDWKYAADTEVGAVLQPVLAAEYEESPAPAGRHIYHLRAD
ncbi:MAG: glycosyltransferase family 39 protein [Caulobacterales bacterium]|jgi:hypothetical protein|nr:glycosyltransferase family 39 protein [Caulobacterales bacterium]